MEGGGWHGNTFGYSSQLSSAKNREVVGGGCQSDSLLQRSCLHLHSAVAMQRTVSVNLTTRRV